MTNEQTHPHNYREELKNAPPLLYKYCSIETAEKILSSTTVKLSSPRDFNDPFDTHFRLEKPTQEKLRNWICTNYPDRPHDWLALTLTAGKRLNKGEMPHEVEQMIAKMGISCFSEIRDGILMWGHYAEHHSGICLGFRMDMLSLCLTSPFIYAEQELKLSPEQSFSSIPKKLRRLFVKIDYVDNLPIFKVADISEKNNAKFIQQKALCWSYEKEWRIISPYGGAGELIEFPQEVLAEIIFGVKSTDESIEKIRKLAVDKGYSAKFIQAKQSATKYEIEFAPCPD